VSLELFRRVASCRVLGWLALTLACESQTHAPPAPSAARAATPVPSATARAAVTPDLVTPVAAPTNARWGEPGLFGFRRADLPTVTTFVHERPRSGRPSPAAFTLGGRVGMVVDGHGGVWLYSRAQEEERKADRVGRVPSSDVRQMLSRARAASQAAFVSAPGCKDCGGSIVRAHGIDGAESVTLAEDGVTRRALQSTDADAVLRWLLALRERVRGSLAPGPFDLELPIVSELRSLPIAAEAPAHVALELEHSSGGTSGLVVDAVGGVFRFSGPERDRREFRRIGKVERASVVYHVRLAERAATSEWQDVSGRWRKSQLRCYGLRGTGGEGTVISDDSEFGKRRTGKAADEVIAWMYALDRQGLPVFEQSWPTPPLPRVIRSRDSSRP
jgi:hypothetical protein